MKTIFKLFVWFFTLLYQYVKFAIYHTLYGFMIILILYCAYKSLIYYCNSFELLLPYIDTYMWDAKEQLQISIENNCYLHCIYYSAKIIFIFFFFILYAFPILYLAGWAILNPPVQNVIVINDDDAFF